MYAGILNVLQICRTRLATCIFVAYDCRYDFAILSHPLELKILPTANASVFKFSLRSLTSGIL
jgi:hypothetical protein